MEPEIDIFWLCDRKCSACVPPGEETCMNEWCHHTIIMGQMREDLGLSRR